MPKNCLAKNTLQLVVCLVLFVSGCSPKNSGSNITTNTATTSPLPFGLTNPPSTDRPTSGPTASRMFQGEYKNYYASILPGEYLACQIYNPTRDFADRLDLINVDDSKVIPLLEGIPVSTITTDGKHLVFGSANGGVYLYDLSQDRFEEISLVSDHFREYDYPEISTKSLEIVFVHQSQGLLIWSMNEMLPILDVEVLENTNDLILQKVNWSVDGDAFAFYLRYTRGPKPIEGLYVVDKSCLKSLESCPLDTNKLITEPYGSAPIAWTPDGNLAVVDWAVNNGASIKIYDVSNTRSIIETIDLDSSQGNIVSLFWSPLKNSIAVQQSNANEILILSTSGEIQNRLEGCSGQLLGWINISANP